MIMNYLTGTSSSASSSTGVGPFGGATSGLQKGGMDEVVVSERLSKINEAFVANVVATLAEHPDALLFPVLDSYVRHVQTVLSPHLPKDLVGEENNSFSSFTKFLDKFKVAMSGSDVSSESMYAAANLRTTPGPGAMSAFSNNGPLIKSNTTGVQSSLEKLPGFTLLPSSRVGPNASSSTVPSSSSSSSSLMPNKQLIGGTGLGSPPQRTGDMLKRPEAGVPTGAVAQKMPDKPFARLDMLQNSSKGIGGPFTFLPMPVPPSIQTATVSASPRSSDVGFGGQPQREQEEEESEEPPKNEFKQVKEENSLYEVRCKIYGKLNGAYKDKGVGVLYIKKSDSNADKYQAVVRAENNLGTILLNILLNKDLPVTANGKNVVTCDPLGDNGKPLTVVIKLKSEEDATELLNKLKGYSKISHSS